MKTTLEKLSELVPGLEPGIEMTSGYLLILEKMQEMLLEVRRIRDELAVKR